LIISYFLSPFKCFIISFESIEMNYLDLVPNDVMNIINRESLLLLLETFKTYTLYKGELNENRMEK
jgi:hypothetical protein